MKAIARLTFAILVSGICLNLSAGRLWAQSIDGIKVGDKSSDAVRDHSPFSSSPPPRTGPPDAFLTLRWTQPGGNSISFTTSPEDGRIVFIESDWSGNSANAATDVPGLSFGSSKLADIREKFGSNGFGYKTNAMRSSGQELVSINCYQFTANQNLILALVTTLSIADVPTVSGKPKPDTGQGKLVAVMLADQTYLQGIWGSDRIFDPKYQPIEWK